MSLIGFRAVQGVGAGSIGATVNTIAGDLYDIRERGKVQGWLSSVWGVSAVVAPALGGVFAEYATWRWIFLVNLPLGAVALVVILRDLHEQVERHRHRIDYAGALLLLGAAGLLILGLLQGGVVWPWWSAPSVTVFGAGLACAVGAALVERRAAEPVLPPWLWRNRVTAGSYVATGVGRPAGHRVVHVPADVGAGRAGAVRRRGRLRPGGHERHVAPRVGPVQPPLPADRLPRHGRCRGRARRGSGSRVRADPRGCPGLAARAGQRPDGCRAGADHVAADRRTAVHGRLGATRRHHRRCHVLEVPGPEHRRGRLRRGDERRAEPPALLRPGGSEGPPAGRRRRRQPHPDRSATSPPPVAAYLRDALDASTHAVFTGLLVAAV